MQEKEFIFWADIIEVGIVNTNTPLAVFLGDNNDVGYPFRILNISNEASCKELVNFLFNDFSAQRMKTP